MDIQSAQFNYLPRLSFAATYTHLNDELAFPQSLQTLLYGTQKLLIKEAKNIPFNTALPLQPVTPIQKQDFEKTTVEGQRLLFVLVLPSSATERNNTYHRFAKASRKSRP